MKSKKGELAVDKVITIILVVMVLAVIIIIIFLNKEKMSGLLASVGRILRFKG